MVIQLSIKISIKISVFHFWVSLDIHKWLDLDNVLQMFEMIHADLNEWRARRRAAVLFGVPQELKGQPLLIRFA